ncbi:MAG: hypothetical protein K6A82_00155 [Prevotella sp.]|nr:hypothetical protein [Prevotella sp.]
MSLPPTGDISYLVILFIGAVLLLAALCIPYYRFRQRHGGRVFAQEGDSLVINKMLTNDLLRMIWPTTIRFPMSDIQSVEVGCMKPHPRALSNGYAYATVHKHNGRRKTYCFSLTTYSRWGEFTSHPRERTWETARRIAAELTELNITVTLRKEEREWEWSD